MPDWPLPNADELKRVEDYFQSKSDYWKEVYEDAHLDGVVYHDRMALTLEWVDALGFPAGVRVLEEGCGAGLTTVALAGRGFRVDAMDTAEAMLNLTQARARNSGVEAQVTTHQGDAHQLAFEEARFSLVCGLGLLPWLPRPGVAVREMTRVLKPGGYVLISSDNRWCLNHLLDPSLSQALSLPRRALRKLRHILFHRPVGTGTGTDTAFGAVAHRYSISEVDDWVSAAGLRKLRSTTVGFGPFTLFEKRILPDATGIRLHRWLQRLALRNCAGIRSAGWHYIVLAQKPGAERPPD